MRPISRNSSGVTRGIDPPASAKTFRDPSDPHTAERGVLVEHDLVAAYDRVLHGGHAVPDGLRAARVVHDVIDARVRQIAEAPAAAEGEVTERLERRDLIRPRVAELRDEVEYVLGGGEPVAAHRVNRERQDVAHPAHADGVEELSEQPVAENLS